MKKSCIQTTMLLASILIVSGCQMQAKSISKCGMWVDVYRGEPAAYNDMLEDLAGVDVVYLGERHTLMRHHEIQYKVVSELIKMGYEIVLGLEQIEAFQQPIVDKYNQGQIDYEQLAEEINWADRWSNYLDYREIVEIVHDNGGTIAALNARKETVRKVAMMGLNRLAAGDRAELADEIDVSNEQYRQLMNRTMMVMSHVKDNPKMLENMFTAQVCRDETMAENMFKAIRDCKKDKVKGVVLCGSGHVNYRNGIPDRLKRRMPEVKDRVIVLSSSGDVTLSKKMKAMSREVTISHQNLKALQNPIADYLHVVNLSGELDIYSGAENKESE